MRRTGIVASLAAVLVSGACGRGAPPAPAPLGPVEIEARELTYSDGGIRDSLTLVVNDAAQLRDVWQRATSTQGTPPPVPDVDFQRQMLLVVAAGRLRRGDEIHVDSIGRRREMSGEGGQREILAVLFTITEGCRRFEGDSYPLEIVRVRRYQGDVRFIGRRERATNCR